MTTEIVLGAAITLIVAYLTRERITANVGATQITSATLSLLGPLSKRIEDLVNEVSDLKQQIKDLNVQIAELLVERNRSRDEVDRLEAEAEDDG